MPLQDDPRIELVTSTAAESLPDPTTVSGRAHWLINATANTVTWSSTGATPFSTNGVFTATITIPAASTTSVRSDGVHWVVLQAPGLSTGLDFFRSGTGATLPDGVTDTTDSIIHDGRAVFGGTANPATLDSMLSAVSLAGGNKIIAGGASPGTLMPEAMLVHVNSVAGGTHVQLPAITQPAVTGGSLTREIYLWNQTASALTVHCNPDLPAGPAGIYLASGAGSPVQTISVPAGATAWFMGGNNIWVAGIFGITAGRRVFSATGTTNASGDVTFNFGTAFAATPVVSVAFQGAASQSPVDYRITAISTTSVTINVRQSLATVIALLGLTLLAASAPLNGATIHVIAVEAGTI